MVSLLFLENLLVEAFDFLDSDSDGVIDMPTWKKLLKYVRPDLGGWLKQNSREKNELENEKFEKQEE